MFIIRYDCCDTISCYYSVTRGSLNGFCGRYNALRCSTDASIHHTTSYTATFGSQNKLVLAKILLHFRLKAASSIWNINGLFIQQHHNCYACSCTCMINCKPNIFVMITLQSVTPAKHTDAFSVSFAGAWFSSLICIAFGVESLHFSKRSEMLKYYRTVIGMHPDLVL